MDSITTANNEFPKRVLEQAAAAQRIRPSAQAATRLDLRSKTAITFAESAGSPAECAYSLYKQGNGWQLGIHIADVSEYVCENSPLDEEARKRRGTVRNSGNYDREMLPAEIVKICALSAGVDRLAVSVILDLDENCKVINSICEKSVIRVATTCIYSEIDQFQLASDSSSVMLLRQKYAPFQSIIDNMYELAAMFCAERSQRGGLNCTYFRRVYKKDELGKITTFSRVAEPDSRAMLREIGYFAAIAVGETMKKRDLPCIFNGRGAVDIATLDYLSLLVNADKTIKDPAKRAADIADLAKGTPYYDFVCDILAEHVPCADFSVTPIDNSFCGTNTVVSFFNPLSRYTDLLVQRMAKTVIGAKRPQDLNLNRISKLLAEVCREATQAERFIHATRKEYLNDCAVEFIKNNQNDVFAGFPVHTNEDGSILVVMNCGCFATVPAEKGKGYEYSPAECANFKVISSEKDILVEPIK